MPVRLARLDDAWVVRRLFRDPALQEAGEVEMVPTLGPFTQEQAPAHECGPIDRAGPPSERATRALADYALGRAVLEEGSDKLELRLPQLLRNAGRRDAPGFELPIYPGHEQHVAQSGLNRRGSGKQGFGKRIAQATEPHLVDRALFLEEVQNLPHPVPVACCRVEPGQRRGHASLSAKVKLRCGSLMK